MLFNLFSTSRYKIASTQVIPNWYILWGKLDSLSSDVIWYDQQFAIISTLHSPPYAFSPTERFIVVGDIWLNNQIELLQKLGLDPNRFTVTPHQLVAQLWEKWGVECLSMLVGMFVLVVWDRQEQTLWLGRDRTGSRTLYYTNTGSLRVIAPQLRSLNSYRSDELDVVALRDYLCCAFVPGERTLWKQVREIRPGTCLQLPSEKIHSYWQLVEQVKVVPESLEWYGDRLRSLLNQVVQEYLPSNEPVGVFLSGGLDSSSITALATQFHHAPVHTYSIHFGSETANELEFSSLVAEHCQTQHHILEITFRDMWERLPETMAYLDDPIGDPLTVPNLLVGRMASQDVKVILNGEGGDPCFGEPKINLC